MRVVAVKSSRYSHADGVRFHMCVCGARSERNFAVAWFVAHSREKWCRVRAGCEQMACEKLGLEERRIKWGSAAHTAPPSWQIVISTTIKSSFHKGRRIRALAHNRLMPASKRVSVCVYIMQSAVHMPAVGWLACTKQSQSSPLSCCSLKKLVSIPPHCHHSDRWLLAPMHMHWWVSWLHSRMCISPSWNVYAMGRWLKLA